MIQFSFYLDSENSKLLISFNRFLSFLRDRGKIYIRVFGIDIPILLKIKDFVIPLKMKNMKRWYLFISQLKLKRIDANISFNDPMLNGIAFGIVSSLDALGKDHRLNININFLGLNRYSSDFIISYKAFFKQLFKLIFPLLSEIRRGPRKRRE